MSTAEGSATGTDGWTIVVPVKALDRAKSRLDPALPSAGRKALVLAMATDVLRSCLAAPGVGRVRVVSAADPLVRDLAARVGAEFVPEPSLPRSHVDPLNAALTAALAGVPGPVGVVAADLPELRPHHLARILASAERHPHSTVADHRGAGTTMAFWTGAPDSRVCRFGPDSAARFRAGGAVTVGVAADLAAASRDVDIPADLATLSARDVGAATAGALRDPSTRHATHADGISATMVP
ncbi:2-phospho-L-lactate guanylyltransferase [Dietzia cinnamea]|uniref:2-phospho-L-lactate guanylyltransferase n=1 Tax=Dietzia cinnamea TaxID=321318 RepID=UPI0021A5B289|nr:2-phospho-L-lactate guanylyltransferase [Dietzia cinnamea]MCT1712735.1 2-phospho-L-lactate guanylyltransferase [Dietzia cinnamea]